MDPDDLTWRLLDDVVAELIDERSAATRRRYLVARQRLLSALAGEAVGTEEVTDLFARLLPILVSTERLPDGHAAARAYLTLVSRVHEHVGGDPALLAEARARLGDREAARPPDAWATRMPDRFVAHRPPS